MQDGTLPLNMILDQVGRDKGIEKKVLIEAIEAAILTAAKRTFGGDRDLEARFNEETGAVDLFQYMTVVEDVEIPDREITLEQVKMLKLEATEGEELGFQIFYREEDDKQARKQDKEFGEALQLKTVGKGFGRIAAQTAKQVIIQRVRDAERDNIYNEYKDRKGEVIAGVVRRFERNNNIIVDLGRTEAVVPAREQAPRESYRPGDRLMAYVKDIDRDARGPLVILSRTDVGLLQKLFEMEVPEIYEGIVKIVTSAREPGARSKIAVSSRDADVDPVGACVGMRGARVQAVVQELRGEKIDIVPWDHDPARFVCNAIQPAEVARVIIDEAGNSMELVVPDDKLSIAIGRRGQNVRLASQLTGWKLDVIAETNFEEREEAAISALALIEGIDEGMARSMYKLGFRTVEEVAEAEAAELLTMPGLGGPDEIAAIQESAFGTMEVLRQTRLQEAAEQEAPLMDRQRLLLIRGVGGRTVDLLVEAGYNSPAKLAKETDPDRLSINAGISVKKAGEILEGVQAFNEREEQEIEARRQEVAESRRQSVATDEKIAEAATEETTEETTEEPEDTTEEPEDTEAS